ncbi:GDSL esterase/lipase At5g45670-like [Rhododendron vialii]|uniref:GDSL esterase/lipase At5g45670-like n=1 Tax=Rhododendron vialii TaxID=182163 RepID=UPI00265E3853|nr:GDSL esterase/lipase At5g45670-like [Rhododendron vialii]
MPLCSPIFHHLCYNFFFSALFIFSSMACELKILLVVSVLPLVSILIPLANAKPQVPCYFIFGDSLVDNGNNNDLETLAKANHVPYGIDFPAGPTGRFSNGRTMADFLAQLLGFDKFIPPFSTAIGTEILMGVNYASAGAGIRDESGKRLGDRISMNKQLLNHLTTASRIAVLLGSKNAAANYLSKCLYSVGMGSNDYINNYLMPEFFPRSRLYDPQQYSTTLIKQYSKQLRTLYKYGARKVVLLGLNKIGCIPAEITIHYRNRSLCVDKINSDVQLFNDKLISLVDILNNDLTGANFIYVNMSLLSLGDSSSTGITVMNSPCCKGRCTRKQVPCTNRSTYAFWDRYHPTEAASSYLASRAYAARTPFDVYPFDIRRLALL